MGCDHGMLFQEGDRKRRRRGSIIYGYYEQHPERDVTQKRNLFLPLPTVNGSATQTARVAERSQATLNEVLRQLNSRPRKTLIYETPAERFSQPVASSG